MPTILVLGVGALVDAEPPVAVVYHFKDPPVEVVAVKANGIVFLQYFIVLPTIPLLVLIGGAIGFTVTV